MSDKVTRYLVSFVKIGLLVLPALSLIVAGNIFSKFFLPGAGDLFFPFITGKNFFFRIAVEILSFFWVLLMVFDKKYRPKKSPVLFSLAAVLFVLILASVFGQNFYRSFWSNYERMEGLVGHFHLFLYFLALTSFFKTKKDWQKLFASMLSVSFIAVVYGLLQWFGKAEIHQSNVRLDATFGNSTYLAIFLIFHMALTALFLYWFRNIWSRIGLSVFMVAQFLIMFLTATRGALLGFLLGLVSLAVVFAILYWKKNVFIRYSSVGFMVILAIVVALFLFFKNTDFVKNNYFLGRLASTSFSEKTVMSRFIIWKISWKGFQEHPILGYGPENYNLVFNKYYEPELWKQEPWFDRSHNIIFDWLINAGILGLLAYLSIFGSAFYMLRRSFKSKSLGLFEIILVVALFGVYFFHNLFVFDNLTSYFMFFTMLGFIHSSYFWHGDKNSANAKIADTKFKEIGFSSYLAVTGAFALVIFSLYFVNLKPLLANQRLIQTLYVMRAGQSVDDVLQKFDDVFSLRTFGAGEAREQLSSFANAVSSSGQVSIEQKNKVLSKAIEEMEKQVVLTKNKDARYLIMLSVLYNRSGRLEEAMTMLMRAKELSPKKQHINFVIADAYLAAGKYKEALAVLQEAYDWDKTYHEAAKNLAMVAILNNQEQYANKILDDARKIHGGYITTLQKSIEFLNVYAKVGNFEKVRDIWIYLIAQEPNNAQYHVSLAATYLQLKEKEQAIKELQIAVQINPSFKTQADYFISDIRAGRNP
ncbi:MAG: O-antigen ligase family protein [bacterium]|nr:O-antigen ligase family protein [bacterium]